MKPLALANVAIVQYDETLDQPVLLPAQDIILDTNDQAEINTIHHRKIYDILSTLRVRYRKYYLSHAFYITPMYLGATCELYPTVLTLSQAVNKCRSKVTTTLYDSLALKKRSDVGHDTAFRASGRRASSLAPDDWAGRPLRDFPP